MITTGAETGAGGRLRDTHATGTGKDMAMHMAEIVINCVLFYSLGPLVARMRALKS